MFRLAQLNHAKRRRLQGDRGEGNVGASDGSAEALNDGTLKQKLTQHAAQSGGNGTPHFRIGRPFNND